MSESATTAPDPVSATAMWSARHPRMVILAWLVLVAATFSLSLSVTARRATENEILTGDARRAAVMATSAGFPEPAVEIILVTRNNGAAFDESNAQAAEDIRSTLAKTPHVAAVTGPVPSADNRAVIFRATITGDRDTATERLEPLHQATAQLDGRHGDLTIKETGGASIANDFQIWLGNDLDKAAAISLPMTLVILLIAFGALLVAGLPLVVGAGAVLSAFGLWGVASHLVPDQGLVRHVILLIGMAVGVDYALFYLRRFREEKHAGAGPVEATRVAARTAGHSVMVSGAAVSIAMAGLLIMRETLFSGVAIGAVLVVLLAMLSAVTVMPALMCLMHRWVDRPRVPFAWRLTNSGREPRLLRAVLRPAIRHPRAAVVASFLLLGLMAVPALGMRLKMTTLEDYPRTLTSMQTYDEVLRHYPDSTSSARLVANVPTADRAGLLDAASRVTAATAADTGLFGAAEQPWISADGRTLVLDISVPHKPDTTRAQTAVDELRSRIVPAQVAALPGVEQAVGGDIAANLDYTRNLQAKIPWVLGIVVALTFLFMLVVYRSLAIALITVLLNVMSTLASFGLLTLIFQRRWAEKLLGFTSNGHTVSWVPLMLFVILSGLSLDYHVLVVNRIRENARAGLPVRSAVMGGLVKTAGVVTSAALVMIGVFSVFGMLTFVEMKQIGVGLALATLLDVTLVRLVALPSMLVSCGSKLWWPGGRGAHGSVAEGADFDRELAELTAEDDLHEGSRGGAHV